MWRGGRVHGKRGVEGRAGGKMQLHGNGARAGCGCGAVGVGWWVWGRRCGVVGGKRGTRAWVGVWMGGYTWSPAHGFRVLTHMASES